MSRTKQASKRERARARERSVGNNIVTVSITTGATIRGVSGKGLKGKTMEGEVDPNAVTGGQIKKTNGELY